MCPVLGRLRERCRTVQIPENDDSRALRRIRAKKIVAPLLNENQKLCSTDSEISKEDLRSTRY